jgi:hypothetical protein
VIKETDRLIQEFYDFRREFPDLVEKRLRRDGLRGPCGVLEFLNDSPELIQSMKRVPVDQKKLSKIHEL